MQNCTNTGIEDFVLLRMSCCTNCYYNFNLCGIFENMASFTPVLNEELEQGKSMAALNSRKWRSKKTLVVMFVIDWNLARYLGKASNSAILVFFDMLFPFLVFLNLKLIICNYFSENCGHVTPAAKGLFLKQFFLFDKRLRDKLVVTENGESWEAILKALARALESKRSISNVIGLNGVQFSL